MLDIAVEPSEPAQSQRRKRFGRRWVFAWKMSARSTVLLMAFVSAALIFALILMDLSDLVLAEASFNGIEIVLPLLAGMSAALIFAPDDEPILELMMSSPRPLSWVLYERLTVLGLLQLGIGLAGSLIVASQPSGEPYGQHVIRWLAPTVAMIGICLWASVWGRRNSYGVLMAVVICAGMAIANDVLLARFPDLWTVIFYVQPRDLPADQYLLNRLILIAIGVVLTALVFVRLRDSEKLLGTGDKRA
ncbi:MAG: hypothetical protein IPK19_03645 [Chloroflexi bacterium]|nr:hypothetical protein [Chloroflexota bacterium]